MQSEFATLLTEYLDLSCAWFTGIENKPHSRISGMLQRRRGCRSGLPDMLILARRGGGTLVIFIELKSCRGRLSRAQKQVRLEMLPTGVKWYWARTARAALAALRLEGIQFRKAWRPAKFQDWEGPFSGAEKRVPAHPVVAAERREEKRRYRLRQKLREQEAARPAAERRYGTDFPASTRGDGELPGTPCCTPRQRSRPGDQLPSKTKFGP